MMISLLLSCGLLLADGVRPRAGVESYPAHAQAVSLRVGAEMLSAAEVRNSFATDLNRGYLVVEVGLFPDAGQAWDVTVSDFSLRLGSGKVVRPVSGETIASVLQQKSAGRHKEPRASDIGIYPSATVGYETGGINRNGVPGNNRNGGWYGGGGVGVGIGGSGGGPGTGNPRASDANRSTMEMELTEKGLPEGEVRRPVAGYLYFPIADVKAARKAAFELLYQSGAGDKVRVLLPAARN